ncbi:MAG: alpha-amylase family glycosyl hydrolase [Microscillaceae bacterium]|jgi:alpha-amylase|nr:alpha-amylase family glycosyl hydrolase [Microscillaceae bacterium]
MKRLISFVCLTFVGFMLMFCNPKSDSKTTEETETTAKAPFLWESANIYFLMTDRFFNGDQTNDVNFDRNQPTGKLRGFMGGDIKGITAQLKANYFRDLGIDAIWFTPIFEQNHGVIDEGTGNSYGFHGYWARDWTSLDPNFGNFDDLKEMVQTAHSQGIRVILDVVLNHTGPVTAQDPVFPNDWVRTTPKCEYKDYKGTVECTLTKNLPDVKTESDQSVEVPASILDKWKKDGREKQELAELDEFFQRTKLPKSPKNYIIKWLCDYVAELGIDGFRVDTAKHIEETIGKTLYQEAAYAFELWKKNNPKSVLDTTPFYMVGEVYGYGASNKRLYDYGDKKVDYFANGYSALINFQFVYDAQMAYEQIFSRYDSILRSPEMDNVYILNYLSSHDDGNPFDKERKKPLESATKLLLTPGAVQIYYGDETSRPLMAEGAQGDANLRAFMNWDDLKNNAKINGFKVVDIQKHWQKLAKFRQAHPAVGAGKHEQISAKPYIFKRTFKKDKFQETVAIGLDLNTGKKELDLGKTFADDTQVIDAYSGVEATVKGGKVSLDSPYTLVLLSKK